MAGITLGGTYTSSLGTLPSGAGNGRVVGAPIPVAPKPAPPPPPPPPPPAPTYVPAPAPASSGPSLTFGGNTFTNVYNTTQQAAPAAPAPSMENLQAFGSGEGLREGLQREGWSGDPMTELDVPGGRSLPFSSRALATLAGRQGRVY